MTFDLRRSSILHCDPPVSLPPTRKPQEVKREKEPKKPVIKKPLNAFMLYMKEMRAKVIAECTLKESAAINQILGRRVRSAHIQMRLWSITSNKASLFLLQKTVAMSHFSV